MVSTGAGCRQPRVPLRSYSSHDPRDFGSERLFSPTLSQSACSPAKHNALFPHESSQGADPIPHLPRLVWLMGVLLMSPGLWHGGFPSGSVRPSGVSGLSCPGSALKRACSDAPSRDSPQLSLEQPSHMSLGCPAARLCLRLFLPCSCAQGLPARSRVTEGGRALVAAVPPGSSSLGQEIIRDCLMDVPYLSHSG